MKKLFNIMILAAMAFSIVACSDDTENPYDKASSIQVVSADLSFTGSADTGKVVVSALEGISSAKLSSTTDWATATVNGNEVTVTVTANPDLEGRSSLLTIWSGKDSVNVPVHQNGFKLKTNVDSLIVFADSTSLTRTYTISNTAPVSFEGTDDWFTAKISGSELTISAQPNKTGHVRTGYLYYLSGNQKDSVLVKQGEFADIAGYYTFNGYSATTFKAASEVAMITTLKGKPILYLAKSQLIVPVTYNKSDLSLTINAGEIIDSAAVSENVYYYLATVIGDYSTGASSYSNKVQLKGYFDYDKDEGTYLEFLDNGTLSGGEANTLQFLYFTSKTLSDKTITKYGEGGMIYPYLLEYTPTGSKKYTQSLPKKMSKRTLSR